MDESDEPDELERIRAAKREQLRERAEQDTRQASSASAPISIDSPAHLQEVLETHSVVLTDFYADWCGPCQMLAPTLETIAAQTPATVAKIDTEALPALAQQYGVRGLPTLVLFVDAEPAEQLVGMQQEARLRSVIDRHVGQS